MEANLIIACFLLSLRFFIPGIAHTLLCAAVCNGILIIENLIPTKGTDGEQLLGILFGVRDISKYAEKVAHSKKLKSKLKKNGFAGRMRLLVLYMVRRRKALYFTVFVLGYVFWTLMVL